MLHTNRNCSGDIKSVAKCCHFSASTRGWLAKPIWGEGSFTSPAKGGLSFTSRQRPDENGVNQLSTTHLLACKLEKIFKFVTIRCDRSGREIALIMCCTTPTWKGWVIFQFYWQNPHSLTQLKWTCHEVFACQLCLLVCAWSEQCGQQCFPLMLGRTRVRFSYGLLVHRFVVWNSNMFRTSWKGEGLNLMRKKNDKILIIEIIVKNIETEFYSKFYWIFQK